MLHCSHGQFTFSQQKQCQISVSQKTDKKKKIQSEVTRQPRFMLAKCFTPAVTGNALPTSNLSCWQCNKYSKNHKNSECSILIAVSKLPERVVHRTAHWTRQTCISLPCASLQSTVIHPPTSSAHKHTVTFYDVLKTFPPQ